MIGGKTKIAVLMSVLLAIVFAGSLWQAGGLSPGAAPEKIIIGSSFNNMNGLLYIAMEKGLDREYGVELAIKPYQAGRDAIKDAKASLVDLACIGEFVLVKEILSGAANLRCLCAISAGDVFEIIARRDRDIGKLGDLRGKIIGVPLGTQGEFLLGRLLTLNRIGLKEITINNLKPAGMAEALAAGEVDAVLWVPPFTTEIIKRMGDNAVILKAQEGQDYYVLLAGREERLKAKGTAMEQMLRALGQAAEFQKQKPGEAREIIARWSKVPTSQLSRYIVRYEVFLDSGLLLAMEDQAAWMIRNGLTDKKQIPDFLGYLAPGPLQKVNPKAVRLGATGHATSK